MSTRTIHRAWPLTTITMVLALLVFPSAGIDLWWSTGWAAQTISAAYVAALTATVIRPDDYRPHMVTMPLGMIWWAGRGIAFAHLAVDGAPHLWGLAVRDGIGAVAAYAALHMLAVDRIVGPTTR